MSRLIDADDLDMYECLRSYYGDAWRDAQKAIDDAPTVDAVPVVRCKDCRYWDAFPTASSTPYTHECSCRYPHRGTSGDDFCSW